MKKLKFKIGDWVRVRPLKQIKKLRHTVNSLSSLQFKTVDGCCQSFTDDMFDLCGEIARISDDWDNHRPDEIRRHGWRITFGKDDTYYWLESWLEGVPEETVAKLRAAERERQKAERAAELAAERKQAKQRKALRAKLTDRQRAIVQAVNDGRWGCQTCAVQRLMAVVGEFDPVVFDE